MLSFFFIWYCCGIVEQGVYKLFNIVVMDSFFPMAYPVAYPLAYHDIHCPRVSEIFNFKYLVEI